MRGTLDVVMKQPYAPWLQHIALHVLRRVARRRLLFHTPFDRRDMFQILGGEELITMTLDFGQLRVRRYTDGAGKMRGD